MENQYTLEQWLEEWVDTYKCSLKDKSIQMYQYAVSLICKYPAGKMPLTEPTEKDLQDILNHLFSAGYSKSTLSKVKMTLRQSFVVALRQGEVRKDPARYLYLPAGPTKKIMSLSEQEQLLVEQCCHVDPQGHLFIFLLKTGLRRSEMLNLKWSDYDSANNEIFIRKSKTAAGIRTVHLIKEADAIIKAQPRINEYIFTNTQGRQVKPITMRRLYERLRAMTDIPHITNHVCRHTFATRLCEKNVPPKAIAQIIGHARADYVLDIYIDMEKKQLRKAVDALEDESSKTRTGELLIELPQEQYQVLIRLAFEKGMPIDNFIVYHMKMLCREYVPR